MGAAEVNLVLLEVAIQTASQTAQIPLVISDNHAQSPNIASQTSGSGLIKAETLSRTVNGRIGGKILSAGDAKQRNKNK